MTKRFFSILFILVGILSFSQSKWNVRFYNELIGREYLIYADNEEEMPMSAKFKFTLKNMQSTLESDSIIVIPPKTKGFLVAKLSAVTPTLSNSFSYTNTYNFGNVLAKNHDDTYLYDLPYEKGKSHLVFQGYGGKLSHKNQLSLDFNLKIGDKIYAAREGKVVQTEEKHNSNCSTEGCAKFNNKIIILHSDGTFAEYLHLKQNGVEVNIGDDIMKGQFLGYSGNTGWSTGPHLHFAVFFNRLDGKRDYIKTKFKTSSSEGEILQENKIYTKNY